MVRGTSYPQTETPSTAEGDSLITKGDDGWSLEMMRGLFSAAQAAAV